MGNGRKVKRAMLKKQFEELDLDKLTDEELYNMVQKLNTIKTTKFKDKIEKITKHMTRRR